jgi:serine/threonine protein kinase
MREASYIPEGRDAMSRLVNDRYTMLEVIGQGAMGKVWRGHDELLDRDVAIKELLLDPGLNDIERAELADLAMHEARSTARLSHPGIITVFDVVQEDGVPLIVMELVHGHSLAEILKTDVRLAPKRVAEIGSAMLDALREAHVAGIVHRDLKPANVLITDRRVIITDFGIAQRSGHQSAAAPGEMTGTPAFMAPEQAEGAPASAAADLWSLGATLYNAVEGRPPYNGPDYVSVLLTLLTQDPEPPRAAGPLTPLLTALLQRDPTRRATADHAATLLTQALTDPPPPSPGPAATASPGATTTASGAYSGGSRTTSGGRSSNSGHTRSSGSTYAGSGRTTSGSGGSSGSSHTTSGGGRTTGGGRAASPVQRGHQVPGRAPGPVYGPGGLMGPRGPYRGTNKSSVRTIGRVLAFIVPAMMLMGFANLASSVSHMDPRPASSASPRDEFDGFGIPPTEPEFTAAAVSPDGKLVAVGRAGKPVRLYDLAGHKQVRQFAPLPSASGGSDAGTALAFSPDGLKLAAGDGLQQPVQVFDVATGVAEAGHAEIDGTAIHQLQFSRDGTILRAVGADGRVVSWDLTADWMATTSTAAQGGSCTAVMLSPDGATTACLDTAGSKITLRNTQTGASIGTLTGPGYYDGESPMVFSPDGRTLAIADEYLTVWDVKSGKLLDHTSQGVSARPDSLVFAQDGKTLVAAGDDRTDNVWRLGTDHRLAYIGESFPDASSEPASTEFDSTAPDAIAVTPDSTTLVSAGGGYIRRISLSTAENRDEWPV